MCYLAFFMGFLLLLLRLISSNSVSSSFVCCRVCFLSPDAIFVIVATACHISTFVCDLVRCYNLQLSYFFAGITSSRTSFLWAKFYFHKNHFTRVTFKGSDEQGGNQLFFSNSSRQQINLFLTSKILEQF